jgi:hypothetical protein
MPSNKQLTKTTTTNTTTTPSKGKVTKKQNFAEEDVEQEQEQEQEQELEQELEELEELDDAEDVEEDTSGDKKKSKKYEYICESVEDGFAELKRIDGEIKTLIKYRDAVLKATEKSTFKQLKQNKKRRSNENSVPREANGFVKPKTIPQKFKDFYESNLKDCAGFSELFANFDINVDVPRTNVTKMIYHYIRTNSLYNKKEDGTLDKRSIKPNSVIKNLFDLEDGENVTFNNFQTYMNRLYEIDEEVEIIEDDLEEQDKEQDHELSKVSKGKKVPVVTK